MKDPPDFGSNPDATIQLNRADLPSDLTLHDPDEEPPLPSRGRTAPPPLPPHALSQAPAPPVPYQGSQPPIGMAQEPPKRSPVVYVAILGAVLCVGFGGAFLALRVLSPKTAATLPGASALGASSVPAPATASGSAAPMITIPTVEMN